MEEIWHQCPCPGLEVFKTMVPIIELLNQHGLKSREHNIWILQLRMSPAEIVRVSIGLSEIPGFLECCGQPLPAPATEIESVWPASPELPFEQRTAITLPESSEPALAPADRQLTKLFSDLTKHLAAAQKATSPPLYAKDSKPLPVSGSAETKDPKSH